MWRIAYFYYFWPHEGPHKKEAHRRGAALWSSASFVHISNISAFQAEHFRLQSCHILLSNCSLSPSIKTKSGLYLIPVRTRRTRGTSRSFFAQRKVFKQRHIFYPRFMDNISADNKFFGLKVKHVSSLHQSNHVKTNQTFLALTSIEFDTKGLTIIHCFFQISSCCHTRLHLVYSAKLRIWQVPACKMDPQYSIIIII